MKRRNPKLSKLQDVIRKARLLNALPKEPFMRQYVLKIREEEDGTKYRVPERMISDRSWLK